MRNTNFIKKNDDLRIQNETTITNNLRKCCTKNIITSFFPFIDNTKKTIKFLGCEEVSAIELQNRVLVRLLP